MFHWLLMKTCVQVCFNVSLAGGGQFSSEDASAFYNVSTAVAMAHCRLTLTHSLQGHTREAARDTRDESGKERIPSTARNKLSNPHPGILHPRLEVSHPC